MTTTQLTGLVNQPETHRLIVGDYDGAYSLGVTDDPPAFLLRVEPADAARFPSAVTVRGQRIPVVVRDDFRAPRPQAAH